MSRSVATLARLRPLLLVVLAVSGEAQAADLPEVAVIGLHAEALDLAGQRAASAQVATAIDQAGRFYGLPTADLAERLRGREAILLEEAFLAQGRRLFEDGRTQFEQANTDDAIRLLTDAVAALNAAVPAANQTRDLWEAQVYLGTALRGAERAADAEAVFKNAIALSPPRNPSIAKFPPDVLAYYDTLRKKMWVDAGMLRVEASLPGARVYLNGEDRGAAPVTLSGVFPGINHLVARTPSGETAWKQVTLSPKQVVDVTLTLAPPSLPASPTDTKFAKGRLAGALYGSLGERAEVELVLLGGVVDGMLQLQLYSSVSDAFSTPISVPFVDAPTDEAIAALPKLFERVQPDGSIPATETHANALPLDLSQNRLVASLLLGGEVRAVATGAGPVVPPKPPEGHKGGATKWVIAGVASAAAVGAGAVGVWALTNDGGTGGNQATVIIGPLD